MGLPDFVIGAYPGLRAALALGWHIFAALRLIWLPSPPQPPRNSIPDYETQAGSFLTLGANTMPAEGQQKMLVVIPHILVRTDCEEDGMNGINRMG